MLGPAAALLAFSAPAAAAPAGHGLDADVSVGQLVLNPTERGYQGNLPITVTNRGRADTYFSVTIVEPVAGSIGNLSPDSACGFQGLQDNRRVVNCSVPGDNLKPGERRIVHCRLQALTTPRGVAMIARGGRVEVNVGDGSEAIGGHGELRRALPLHLGLSAQPRAVRAGQPGTSVDQHGRRGHAGAAGGRQSPGPTAGDRPVGR